MRNHFSTGWDGMIDENAHPRGSLKLAVIKDNEAYTTTLYATSCIFNEKSDSLPVIVVTERCFPRANTPYGRQAPTYEHMWNYLKDEYSTCDEISPEFIEAIRKFLDRVRDWKFADIKMSGEDFKFLEDVVIQRE